MRKTKKDSKTKKVETRGVKSRFSDAQKRAIVKRVWSKDGKIRRYGIKTEVAKELSVHTRTLDTWKPEYLEAA